MALQNHVRVEDLFRVQVVSGFEATECENVSAGDSDSTWQLFKKLYLPSFASEKQCPQIPVKAIKILLPFPPTYLNEAEFSILKPGQHVTADVLGRGRGQSSFCVWGQILKRLAKCTVVLWFLLIIFVLDTSYFLNKNVIFIIM